MCRLRDLESPKPSTSATPITQATKSSQRHNISSQQPQRQTKPPPQSATLQRDKQSTVVAKQQSAPDRKRETAEEAKLREAVMSEVLDIKPSESWNDIAGLAGAKQVTVQGIPPLSIHSTLSVKEIVCKLVKHTCCTNTVIVRTL